MGSLVWVVPMVSLVGSFVLAQNQEESGSDGGWWWWTVVVDKKKRKIKNQSMIRIGNDGIYKIDNPATT